MARPKQTIIDGYKWCRYHGKMEPVGDFYEKPDITGVVRYHPDCKLAEQTIKDRNKAANPAHTAIIGRARKYATLVSKTIGVTISYQWVLIELHWIGLVPFLHAAISPGGTCLNCGLHWDDPEKYHMAHKLVAPTLTSWAYYHARNYDLRCPGCNCSQGSNDGDHDQLEADHRKWMIVHDWASQAGSPGWPPYDPYFGDIPPIHTAVTETASGLVFGSNTLFGYQQ